MARTFTEFLIPFIINKIGKFGNLTIWTNIILSINHLPKEKIEMTSRVLGHILKFYLFIHKKLSNTSITQIQIKIFWYALHFIKTFMQRFRMGTLWLTEKSSCLAFFASTLLPTYHNRMGHIRKKQLLSSVFSPLYMQVRRRYLFTILYCKGEKIQDWSCYTTHSGSRSQ